MPSVDHGQNALSAIYTGLREHAILVGLIVAYGLAALAVAEFQGLTYPLFFNLLAAYFVTLLIPLTLAFCWHAIGVMIFVRPQRLTRYLLSSLKGYLEPRRLLYLAPILLLIPVFAVAFSFLKSTIPILSPYTWDTAFTRWDYLLHGSSHPWVLLQPVLGYPLVTGGINFLYNLWYLTMYVLLMLQVFDTRNPALRMRFLLSFLLTWIVLGTFGALAFSSMGPCYDPGIASNSGPYAPLMNYLKAAGESVPVPSLELQQMLWDNYQGNGRAVGSGISAMPSMHVAIAALMALFGWHYSRAAGIALTAYALVVLVGSVHLGWHYAVDGYAGALGAWLIWWVVGRCLAGRLALQQNHAAALPVRT
jgi:PAP2 superfamily.